MVREFVAANRRLLQGLAIVLVAVVFGLVFSFRNQEEVILERCHFGMLLLPLFAIGVIHALLLYDSWFVRGSDGLVGRAKKIAFFPIVLVYMLVLIFLFVEFVI